MNKILRVKKIKQLPSHCGPASLAMVLQYHGIDVDQEILAKEFKFEEGENNIYGIFPTDLPGVIEKYGFKAEEITPKDRLDVANKYGFENNIHPTEFKRSSIDCIIDEIDRKSPALLVLRYHIVVAKGYDDLKKLIYINDPDDLIINKIPFSEILKPAFFGTVYALDYIVSVRK